MKKSEIIQTVLNSLEGLSYQEISAILKQVKSIAKGSKIEKLDQVKAQRLIDLHVKEENANQ
ncbi:MAG: hypothetical protein ACO1N0_02775 [Fluviicola sp.]